MQDVALRRALRPSAFLEWCEADGLQVTTGYGVDDLTTLPLAPWPRLGVPATYCHLEGSQGFVGALVAEIPPGAELPAWRHMYEEQVLILKGRGATRFWTDSHKADVVVEWSAGGLFSPPLNALHRHFNTSGLEPVRFVAVNNAPLIFNIFRNPDFVFQNPYEFEDRFAGESDYFNAGARPGEYEDLEVNYIPDVYAVDLDPHPERGVGFRRTGISMARNSMIGHIMAIQVGTYKKAHRHQAGAHVIVLSGKGYSLMWPPGGDVVRVDWHKGSLLVPPEGWYHHHFNTGQEPARHLALRRGLRGVGMTWLGTLSEREGGHMLEYEDEPPETRRMYEEELAKEGIPLKMEPARSTAPVA